MNKTADKINVKGVYFDNVNNGSNISSAISEIGFYNRLVKVTAELVKMDNSGLTVSIDSKIDGKFDLIMAAYLKDDSMKAAVKQEIGLSKGITQEFFFNVDVREMAVSLFLWDGSMIPIMKKTMVKY